MRGVDDVSRNQLKCTDVSGIILVVSGLKGLNVR